MPATGSRRPIKTRSAGWAQAMAGSLARAGVSPNAISLLSVVFAAAGSAALMTWPTPAGLLACAFCVQSRLLCNLMDGLVAVEFGRQTSTGVLYNEVPDRLADSFFLVALGFAAGFAWLGWTAALIAMATAYIRLLGGSLGQPQDFRGPQAKAHRMFVMSVACVLAAVEEVVHDTRWCLLVAVVIIAAGGLLTCGLRLRGIAARLRAAG